MLKRQRNLSNEEKIREIKTSQPAPATSALPYTAARVDSTYPTALGMAAQTVDQSQRWETFL